MAAKTKRQRVERTAKKELVLTPGEILFLWRKRKMLNQEEAAKLSDCSIFNYKKAEYDEPIEGFRYSRLVVFDPNNIHDHEKCMIHRRRSDKLQRQIAKATGVSRTWINRQEKGLEDCSKLLAYWEGT